MEKLPKDFKDFLKLLNLREVRYLVIGGYAVAYHGYVRYTADIDIWVEVNPDNANRIVEALIAFGFDEADLKRSIFLNPGQIIRMGVEPLRIEILTDISGVKFETCYARRVLHRINDVSVPFISLFDLRLNKQTAGRGKDILDLNNLPEANQPG